MKFYFRGIAFFFFFLVSFLPSRLAAEFKDGLYQQSQGTVKLKALGPTEFSFELSTFSGYVPSLFEPSPDNMPRLCEISGKAKITESSALYEENSADSKQKCALTFTTTAKKLQVSAKGCESLCEATSPEGTFQLEDAACADKAIKATRKHFQTQYQAKKYTEAVGEMESLLDRCGLVLSNPDIGWLRNDLALALLRSGKAQGCLKEIANIRQLLGLEGKLAHATEINEKLCRKAGAK